jgi:hypothetical protein
MPLNIQSTDSPWEAFRMTSKSPSEVYDVLGPAGVDGLIRHVLVDCWNALPAGARDLRSWKKRVDEVWMRNFAVWSHIKKPSPAAFFEDLRPDAADGHLRQALIMTWMMLPRGKRDMKDVRAVVTRIYERQRATWEEDEQLLKHGATRKKTRSATKTMKKPAKKPAKKSVRKSARNRKR